MTFRSRIIQALSWNAFTQFFTVVLGLAVSVVLARMLSPQDFGLVTLATGVMAVTAGLADFGFTTFIIKSEELATRDLDSLFTSRLVLALVQVVLLSLLAAPLADYFGHAALELVIQAMSLVVLLSAFSLVPDALLRKRLEFRKLAIVNTVTACVSGITGIGLAFNGFGYWSLVAQYLAGAVCSALLLSIVDEWKPRLAFSMAPLRANKKYLLNTYGLNLVGALVLQGDKLLLGKVLGVVNLGLYMRAFGFAQQVQGFVLAVAEPVVFPALADHGGDFAKARARFLHATEIIGRVSVPIALGIAVVAQPLILFLYGEQWIDAAPILRIVVLGLLVNALNVPWDWLVRTTSEVHILFRWSLVDGPTRLAAMLTGAIHAGVLGAAWGYLLASLFWFLARAWIMGRAMGISGTAFLLVFQYSLLLGSVAAAGGWLGLSWMQASASWLQLIVSGAVGVACYGVVACLLPEAAAAGDAA